MSKSPSGPSRRPRPTTNANTKNAKKNASATRPGPKSRASSKSQAQARAKTQGVQAPPTRFRSRHPVITALVPVGLVVAAIATMVVIKAAGNSNPPASASSHLTGAGTGTGTGSSSARTDTGTTALSPQVVAALSVPAATLDAVGSPSGDVLPTKLGNGTVRKRSGRQAADHLHRRRVLPLLRR